MERLTWEYKDGGMFVDGMEIKNFICDDAAVCTGNAIIRLAAYEDTGLTPEEIEDIKTILDVDGDGKSGEDTLKDLLELVSYRKTGLTPEEITELERKYLNDEHEYCGEYGTDECQFAYRIDKIKQERDFWEREAKKNCSKLGEQRIKLQQMEREMCKLEDTDKCRQC